ncbi:hypothetical protein [Nakamurella lactea]|uniref:hypothetical protein n=1 Tax=Nakamurella lactea TaxID=459515 RepID=UPI000427A78A|nr:hypothetical protein [Nakamurella lactea]
MSAPSASYEVRVSGAVGPAARAAFADLAIEVEPTATVLSGDLSQAELHAVIEQIRALGMQLVDVRRTEPAGDPEPPLGRPPE